MSSLFTNSVQIFYSHALWHMWLGHTSKFVVKSFLDKSISVISELNKVCSTCLRAKQTQNIFLSSQTNATEIFNWIHCDL